MALTLRHQTPQQFAVRLRARFRAADRREAARIATWIMDRLDAGDITDAQMRAVFGLTLAQWSALKTRLSNMRTAYRAIEAARGV